MLRILRSFFAVLFLAVVPSLPAYPQDKPQNPKVVLDLEKPAPTNHSPGPEIEKFNFGETCTRFNQKSHYYGPPAMKPTSIAELMGAPIKAVKIRRYGSGWKKPDDVRKHVAELLKTQTTEVFTYEPWDESVFPDIIATVHFSDHTEGTLEVSGMHVCFSDHSGSAMWLRLE